MIILGLAIALLVAVWLVKHERWRKENEQYKAYQRRYVTRENKPP